MHNNIHVHVHVHVHDMYMCMCMCMYMLNEVAHIYDSQRRKHRALSLRYNRSMTTVCRLAYLTFIAASRPAIASRSAACSERAKHAIISSLEISPLMSRSSEAKMAATVDSP